jgi:hypothetical protein
VQFSQPEEVHREDKQAEFVVTDAELPEVVEGGAIDGLRQTRGYDDGLVMQWCSHALCLQMITLS